MFTEKEIKKMKRFNSTKFKIFCYICFSFCAVGSFFISVHYFMLSLKYAHSINKNMVEIFNGLIEGFSPFKNYDGAYCAAIYNLVISIKDFLQAIMLLLIILFIRIKKEMYLKIINLFESKTKQDIIQNENVK